MKYGERYLRGHPQSTFGGSIMNNQNKNQNQNQNQNQNRTQNEKSNKTDNKNCR